MTRIQKTIVGVVAVVGFSGLGIAGEVKSLMDEPSMVGPVVRLRETKEQFIDRIEHENLNRMYQSVLKPHYHFAIDNQQNTVGQI